MGAGVTKQEKSDVASIQEQVEFDQIDEEKIDTDTIEQQENDKRKAVCDGCFMNGLMNVIALYMCVVCEKYYCKKCFKKHNKQYKSHTVIRVKSESGENDGFDDFMSVVENESEKQRNESLRKTNVCVCDYVNTTHGSDKKNDNYIYGFTGYENKWWVVCDSLNDRIKVFSLSSNILQRYISLGSRPFDVTELIVKNKTTEQDSASGSETTISGTDKQPDRKHLLAVTLPWERLILLIDLGENPAVIHNKIKTKKTCFNIDFNDGKIYISCGELSLHHPWSVCILSVEGYQLKTFRTDAPRCNFTYLSVLNGNIYMTDSGNHRVVCYNDNGRVLHKTKLDNSWPGGICVDRSEGKVYICAWGHNKVYELESDLSRYKPVLDQTISYMEFPQAMCFYSDKLYVGHWSKSRSHVTVVQLL